MNSLLRPLLLGAVLGFLAAVVSCSSAEPCGAANCASGCCDAMGVCQGGTTVGACGHSALSCVLCASGQSCTNNTCVTGSGGGSGGSGGGGGAGGGTAGGSGGAGGGTAGGSGGGTAGGSGGGSAGGAGGGGGGSGGAGGGGVIAIDAGVVNITFGATCPAFSACGGALPGTWTYTSVCIPDSDFAATTSGLDSVCGAGKTTLTNKTGTLSGYVIFTPTNATRKVTGSVSLTATIGGTLCGGAFGCGQINSSLATYGFSGSCAVDAGSCVCGLTSPANINDNGPYTVSGNVLTLTNSSKTYDYCVTGTTGLATRETTAGSNPKEPGFPKLTKQ